MCFPPINPADPSCWLPAAYSAKGTWAGYLSVHWTRPHLAPCDLFISICSLIKTLCVPEPSWPSLVLPGFSKAALVSFDLLDTQAFFLTLDKSLAIMSEEKINDVPVVSHDGKGINEKSEDHVDGGGRRESVAVNIVENPLKASFAHGLSMLASSVQVCLTRGAHGS